MEAVQRQTSHNDHHALKPHKQPLVPNQIPRPPLPELDNPVHGAPKDAHGGQSQRRQEALESPALAQRGEDGALVEGSLAHGVEALTRLDAEVDAEHHEDEEREDLESEAGDHDVVAGVRALALVRGGRGKAAAGSLQQEAEEITGDELERVLVRARVARRGRGGVLTSRVYVSGLILELSGPNV